jgi:peptidoglycan/xylan/chitin deacetylase (PgdA/CDA1 family)
MEIWRHQTEADRRLGAAKKQVVFSILTHFTQVGLATLSLIVRFVYLGFRRLTGKPLPWTFVALMYHSVKPEEVARFSRQMELLKKCAHVVGADFSEADAFPAKRYVAVTFDDGFESFNRAVLPILREKRIPVTVFVATRYLGKLPGWIADEGQGSAKERLMDEEELRALLNGGLVSVGSHSVSHSPLRCSVMSTDDIRFELKGSKQYLEERLGLRITLFALPYGAFDDQVLQLAKEAGYYRVFLSEPLGSMANIDGHVAGRIVASPTDSLYCFWLKALGAYQFLPFAIAAKGRMLTRVRRALGR